MASSTSLYTSNEQSPLKSHDQQKHQQEALSPPPPSIQPRPSSVRSLTSIPIYPKAFNTSAPSILSRQHTPLMIKQKQQMSQGQSQPQGHPSRTHDQEHTHAPSPRSSDRPHAPSHPDHHIMNGPPKGPYREANYGKHTHSRSQSQSLDHHGMNYPSAQTQPEFDYHHHHGHNNHSHNHNLTGHPHPHPHPHPHHQHNHSQPHVHTHIHSPMPHPGRPSSHSRSHSQSQPPPGAAPRAHHPSYTPGPHQQQHQHPSTGPIRPTHAQPRNYHPHPHPYPPNPDSRTHSRTHSHQPSHPQQPPQQPHYDQGFNGPSSRAPQAPDRYSAMPPPSSRRHSNSRHGSSMALDDDEDEDDGEIKQESNRAHPSDGGAKSDNAEHEVHKCMDCGKVYKHPNCLWKHRWEHSTYWKSATKFLLSKHQQVRMMEAAAILLGMDEARAADKDAIVSTVIKQRGMGGPSSTSSSPPTSTKSLSTSPPPSSEAIRRAVNTKPEQTKEEPSSSLGLHASRPRPSVSETQNDIMMLTALRKASSAPSKASGSDQPQAVPSISPKDPSSSSSTPPTLADDESVPELDEEMVVTPPQPSGPNPSDKGMGLGMGMSVGMSMAMEVDPKHYSRQDPHQPFHAQQTYRFPSGYQNPSHPSYPSQQ